jgi:hypothetical protein
VRSLSVTSTQSRFVPGQDHLDVWVSLINESDQDLEFHACTLRYEGSGTGFLARRLGELPALPAGRTVAIRFSVRLPWDTTGKAVIDADVDLLSRDSEDRWLITKSEQPLSFVYQDPDDQPDLSDLPVLRVTTYADELDGGTGVTSVAEAGGEEDLSFREALTLVNNLGTAHRITFDEEMFSAQSAQPIEILDNAGLGDLPTLTVTGSAIDALGLSVRILPSDQVTTLVEGLQIRAARVVIRGIKVLGLAPNYDISQSDDLLMIDTSCGAMQYGSGGSAMYISDSSRVVLRGMEAATTGRGIVIERCPELTIEGGNLSRIISITDSPDTLILDHLATNPSFRLSNSPRAQIIGSTLDSSDAYYPVIVLQGGCEDTVISHNRIIGPTNSNVDGVIVIWGCDRVQIHHTTMARVADTNELIVLADGANGGIQPPVIDTVTATGIVGSTGAGAGSMVEIFSDDEDDMGRWLGEVEVLGGAFSLTGVSIESGQQVRATVTDLAGNTSEASAAVSVP